jgi:hypothetical protein
MQSRTLFLCWILERLNLYYMTEVERLGQLLDAEKAGCGFLLRDAWGFLQEP